MMATIEEAYIFAGEYTGLLQTGQRDNLTVSVHLADEDTNTAMLRVRCYNILSDGRNFKSWDLPMTVEEFKKHIYKYSPLTRLKTVEMPPQSKSAVDFTNPARAEGTFICTRADGQEWLVKIVMRGSGYHLRAYNRQSLMRIGEEKELSLKKVRDYFTGMFVTVKRGRFPKHQNEMDIPENFSFKSWLEN